MASRRLALLTALVTAALGLGAPVGHAVETTSRGAAPTAVRLGPSSIRWRACTSAVLQSAGAQCASLAVPLDYDHPRAGRVRLAISRVHHTVRAARFQGIMLTNPGGPGASGLTLSTLGSHLPGGVGRAYDWIGFDPRGIGASRPALTCAAGYFNPGRPVYEPSTRAVRNAWLANAHGYARACAQRNGAILDHVTTRDSARDMDRLRVALGARQLSYYGFSYGTYLGQVYATLYPHQVRRMVLDSNIDPRRVWYGANLDQDVAFESTERAWFAWLAGHDDVYHLGTTRSAVRTRWFTIRDQLATHPDHGLGYDEWTDIFLPAGYYQSTWLRQGSLFSDYVRDHDATPLMRAYAGSNGDDNGYAGYLAVECTDVRWPSSWAHWQHDNDRIGRIAPFETWANAWYNAPCIWWPAAPHAPVRVNGSAAPPILLIDQTLDAATPYAGSLEVRRRFPRARLIALPGGTSHADSLSGDRCVDDRIAAYLETGALPRRHAGGAADATCAPPALPDPGAPTPGFTLAQRRLALLPGVRSGSWSMAQSVNQSVIAPVAQPTRTTMIGR